MSPVEGDVIVVHGPDDASTALSVRIAGHLSERGLPAFTVGDATGAGQRLLGAGAVVAVHASQVHWSDDTLAALLTVRNAGRPVAVGRCDTSRLPDGLHGLPVLSLIPRRSYPPTREEGGGYEHLVDLLTRGRPKPPRQPAAVFLSYSNDNSPFLDRVLVPLLGRHTLTYFDYQYTELLDASQLEPELERWVVASAVLLIVATPAWQASAWCPKELAFGRRHHKPIVAVWPTGVGRRRAPDCGAGVPVISFGRDTAGAGARLVATLRRQLPH